MLHIFIKQFTKLDKVTYILIKKGLACSLVISLIAITLLFSYTFLVENLELYYSGLSILKTSFIFDVAIIVFAICMDKIKKQIS